MNFAFGRTDDKADRLHSGAFLSYEVMASDAGCARRIVAALGTVPLAHVLVFASPTADFAALMAELDSAFDCPVVGCTSAGEIGQMGYVEDHVVAVGLPRANFAAHTVLIEDVGADDFTPVVDRLIQSRIALRSASPTKPNGFSFLMVDGLSRREDQLVNAIAPSLAGFPLFGGSAGDGLRFGSAFVSLDGQVYEAAATLTYVATDFETRAFSINHMAPTDTRMVVTAADPQNRIVKGINAEPAATEYARLIGKDPAQLDELIFAANPVTVRIGDDYHVRAIQRVNADGDLVFFSAIDEGMVLTVAAPQDMARHLDEQMSALVEGSCAPSILGCDCVLRRIEAQKSQSQHRVNAVFRKFGVVGFSTYGEQIGPLHLNHTMTGVALFPAASRDD
ncbi:MAG: FIST N-terminal domain-containing protein [Pseudomonadota bacterium]